ncbi:hypothetical protein [Nitrosomonas sp.]|uniref:hypothetical protein n=1 Tax=Nitrosomonas sp. TaxID=42353 RepID=UPI002088E6A2|nr:hypothetical protein [Nitrosomonas sp.]GJL75002.1 MAG: hypothetical protein NMNS02_11080 [Nitrosomonas sp.]
MKKILFISIVFISLAGCAPLDVKRDYNHNHNLSGDHNEPPYSNNSSDGLTVLELPPKLEKDLINLLGEEFAFISGVTEDGKIKILKPEGTREVKIKLPAEIELASIQSCLVMTFKGSTCVSWFPGGYFHGMLIPAFCREFQ